jgi:hypothetical protein
MDYDVALDIRIEGAIDSYRRARDKAWREVEGGEHALALAGQVADAVLRISRELIVPGGFESERAWDWIRDFVEKQATADAVKEDLQITLASELVPDTEEMANRCLAITREVMFLEPNESVRRFLRRLTRCYIAGFLPECVMLCRAVLENAVTEVNAALQLKPQPNKEGHVGMAAKLDELRRVNRLDDETRKLASVVWKRGNTAVHKDPTAVQEVVDTVDMTIRVLVDLYRQPLPVRPAPLLPDA